MYQLSESRQSNQYLTTCRQNNQLICYLFLSIIGCCLMQHSGRELNISSKCLRGRRKRVNGRQAQESETLHQAVWHWLRNEPLWNANPSLIKRDSKSTYIKQIFCSFLNFNSLIYKMEIMTAALTPQINQELVMISTKIE